MIAAALAVVATVPAFVAGGCNIVAPIAYAIEGPGTIDAEHELLPVRTAVLVDDRDSILPRTALRVELGEAVGKTLLDEEVVPEVLSTRDVIAYVRAQERKDAQLSMQKIAEGLKVKQLIYVEVMSFDLIDRGGSPRPTATAYVKVLDIDGKQRSYPPPDMIDGREVTAQIREVDPELFRTPSARRTVEDQLVTRLGRQIARLFFEHERLDLGENLQSR